MPDMAEEFWLELRGCKTVDVLGSLSGGEPKMSRLEIIRALQAQGSCSSKYVVS